MDVKNVIEAILKYGHDEDFNPIADAKFLPTDAPAGSQEKIDVLRRRVELGQPLWHELDRVDYSGLTGVIRPREDGQEDEDGTSGPDIDISVELNSTEGLDSESDLDSAFKIHDDQSSLKLPKVSRGLGGFMAVMRSKKNLSPQEEPAEIDFSAENRGRLRADITQAVKPILLELILRLTKELLELAAYSPKQFEINSLTDLVRAVVSKPGQSTSKGKLLARWLGKTELDVQNLMQDALVNTRPDFFDLLKQQNLNKEVAAVVRYAEQYFQSIESGESLWNQFSNQSKSATVLLGIRGLPAWILEAGRSSLYSHGGLPDGYKKSAVKEAPQSTEPVNLSGKVFEDITLDKEICKNLAKDLWKKLQEDPKKLYSMALDLPADGNILSGESEHEYFNRVFLLGLRGEYKSLKNSNYPPILKPLAIAKLDSYFRNSFFTNLNQHFRAIKEGYQSRLSYMDAPGGESSMSDLIYDAIPLELFNTWSQDALWKPVLKAQLSEQLKYEATAKSLNIEEKIVRVIWARICKELPILRSICNSDTFGHARQTLTSL